MTEYDYSPEAYERYISTQRRIARWVDQTERHRPEFSTGNDVTPPVPPTVYGDGEDGYFSGGGTGRRPSKSRDRRHTLSLASHPVYPYSAHYGAPVPPPYPYPPNSAGLMVPGPMPVSAGYTSFSQAVPPPPLMIISPAASHQSHKSRRSQKSRHSQTYMLASAPVTGGGGYYQYPYGTSTGYVYMNSSRQSPNLPPQPGHYYNPQPSQPLRPPHFYTPAANPAFNMYKQPQSAPLGAAGPVTYSYSAPLPSTGAVHSPPADDSNPMHHLPPHVLYQRLYHVGRMLDRRRSRSSRQVSDRGRSTSRSRSASKGRSRSRGRSRTRKPWWNIS